MEVKDSVKNFPETSGVYLMLDNKKNVIYVGKAKNLKKRVTSYFLKNRDGKTSLLVSKIFQIDYILTNNEYDALLLENNLIKKHSPKYNINLKDGKTYPVIRVTNESFPRIFKTRTIVNDNSKYFGPYPVSEIVDIYLSYIKKSFKIRRCSGVLKKRNYPCLYYHINVCSAPCVGKIDKTEYLNEVEKAVDFFTKDKLVIEGEIKEKIDLCSKNLDYENAIFYRDLFFAMKKLEEQQEIVNFSSTTKDYIAYYLKESKVAISVFQMREGKLTGRDIFTFENFFEDNFLDNFLINYYEKYHSPPQNIILNSEFDTQYVEKYLSSLTCESVKINVPSEKRDLSIINMVIENCKNEFIKKGFDNKVEEGLLILKNIFKLNRIPKIIEGFDIAHLAGQFTSASLVQFVDGKPYKKNYQTYKIKSLKAGEIDDFESMREVIARRYSKLLNEKKEMPDIILIDGGLGQVNAAHSILKGLNMDSIFLVGLAKKNEELYFPNEKKPLQLPKSDKGLKILQSVRDEAHRFATKFRSKLEQKDKLG